jgi:hypothetical protein
MGSVRCEPDQAWGGASAQKYTLYNRPPSLMAAIRGEPLACSNYPLNLRLLRQAIFDPHLLR